MQPISNEEIPFEIPSNWKWVHMGEIFQHNTGKALNSSKTDGELLEYITTSNVYWDKFDFKVIKKMPFTESEIEKCTITKGDLLICEGGDIGRSAIWSFDYDMRIQNHLHRLRGYLPEISHKYYFYMMRMYKHSGLIDGRGIGLQGFSSTRVHNLVIPLPPFAEQQRIVERVEEIFKYLNIIDEAQKKYSADAEILKSKLITMGIQGKLTKQLDSDGTAEELYQQIQEEKQKLIKEGKIKKEKALQPVADEEVPFEIPSNWRWCRFGEILNIVSAKRVHQSDWQTSGVPFYRAREISKLCENGYVNNDLYISEELYKEYSKFGIPKAGDLMISAVGTLGKSYIVKETDKFYYKDASVLCIENIGKISSVFLSYILKSEMMKKQIKSNSTGTTVDTLTMIKLIQYYIPLPPLTEQKRIADTLDEVLRVIG